MQYGVAAGNPTTSIDVGNVTIRQFSGLQPGVTYYFRVLAYNTVGLQSDPSNEVSYTPPVSAAAGRPAPAPTLTSVSPTAGTTAGGTTITITGTNFVSGATVRVGGTSATGVTFVSATRLRANTPAGTAGAKSVQVTNPDSQSATLANAFTLQLPPAGHVGVADVGIDGGRHDDYRQRHELRGRRDGPRRRRAGDERLVPERHAAASRTPAGAAGVVSVQVTNPDAQSATRASAFTYTNPAPTITALSPTSGPTAGARS